jgi:uncharacterized small protein (DUF1192 family)
LFPSRALYELVLVMEKEVLMVLLVKNSRIMAVLGNRLSLYVERELAKREFPEQFAALFEVALGIHQASDHLTDERIAHMYEVTDYPPLVMAEKFYRYYVGATFNDFIKAIARDLKIDRDFKRNVAFRCAQLSKRAVETLSNQLKKSQQEVEKLKANLAKEKASK